MRILSLGCGNMGAAILSGIVRSAPEVTVAAIDPDTEQARTRLPPAAPATVFASAAEASRYAPDLVLLAVKPQLFATMTDALGALWPDALIVSVMAGTPIGTIARALGNDRVVRVMPNLPALIGQGMSVGYAAAPNVTAADRGAVQRLFETVGEFSWLADEAQIDACTAVSGSGPGYLFAFAAHLEQAARAEGLPADMASRLTRQTLYGAAAMLTRDQRPASALKAAVASKGGTTEAGLDVLEAPEALPALVTAAVHASHRRARALSRQDEDNPAAAYAPSPQEDPAS